MTINQKPARRSRRTASSQPNQSQLSIGIEDKIAEMVHNKIKTVDPAGNSTISDNTFFKINMTQMFSIIGSLVFGVSAASIYWTKTETNYSNTLEAHDKRIAAVEKTMQDMQQVKSDMGIVKVQMDSMIESIKGQKSTLEFLVTATNAKNQNLHK